MRLESKILPTMVPLVVDILILDDPCLGVGPIGSVSN